MSDENKRNQISTDREIIRDNRATDGRDRSREMRDKSADNSENFTGNEPPPEVKNYGGGDGMDADD